MSEENPTEVMRILKADAIKMYQAMKTLLNFRERTLIPPHTMAPSEAKGYMTGSNAGFKQCSELAQFTIDNLSFDFEVILEQEKANQPFTGSLGGVSRGSVSGNGSSGGSIQ